MCHSGLMTTNGITSGLFALTSAVWTPGDLKQALAWLRVEYKRLGLDPARIRRDVLDRAAESGTISTWTYADLFAVHCTRFVLLRRNADIGTANDDDAYELPYERAAGSKQTEADFAAFRRKPKITDADLPTVTWSPFRPALARARCLTHEQLVSMRAQAH